MPGLHCCFGDLQPRPAINGRRYTNRGPLMNRTFRKVWSRARGTVVVASELAKRRGAGARATRTNRGVGIGLLALALAATGSDYAQAPAVAQKPDATSAESISKILAKSLEEDRKSTRLNSSH